MLSHQKIFKMHYEGRNKQQNCIYGVQPSVLKKVSAINIYSYSLIFSEKKTISNTLGRRHRWMGTVYILF